MRIDDHVLLSFPQTYLLAFAWSPDSTLLVCSFANGGLVLLNALTNQHYLLGTSEEQPYLEIGWFPDSKRFSACRNTGKETGEILFWNISDQSEYLFYQDDLTEDEMWPITGTLAPDGRFVALAGCQEHPIVQVRAVNTGKWVNTFSAPEPFDPYHDRHSPTFHLLSWPPRSALLAGAQQNKLHIWDMEASQSPLATYETTTKWKYGGGLYSNIHSLSWPSDAQLLALVMSEEVEIWNVNKHEKVLSYQEHTNLIQSIVWLPGDTSLLSSSKKEIQRWDAQTGKCLESFPLELEALHSFDIFHMTISPDGSRLAAAGRRTGQDGTIEGVLWVGAQPLNI